MSFNYNETQLSIIDSVQNIMKNFDDDYWLECDQKSIFPHKFYDEIADGGWLGICMPKEFGGLHWALPKLQFLCKKYLRLEEEWLLLLLFILIYLDHTL